MKQLYCDHVSSNGENALEFEVAFFPWMKARKPNTRKLGEVLHDIQVGRWKTEIGSLRLILKNQGKSEYDVAKENLPSFFVSGTAASAKAMLSHSGLIQLDLDTLGESLDEIRAKTVDNPHVLAAFTSPSGNGLKVIFRLKPLEDSVDGEEHKRAYRAIVNYFELYCGIKPDKSCSNINRHCLISYDPDLFQNPRATPFDWQAMEPNEKEERGGSSSLNTPILQSFDTSALRAYDTTPHAQSVGDEGFVGKSLAALGFQTEIEENQPTLWKLYERLVIRRREARGGERNSAIIQAVPHLYRSLSTPLVRIFMEWFYKTNAHVFNDSLEKHMIQVEAMLKMVESSWFTALSPTEQQFSSALKDRGRDTFRIARDLALYVSPFAPAPPEFFLSGESLAERLNLLRKDGKGHDVQGSRELGKLVQFGIIEVSIPGRPRSAGVRGLPTTYRWLLPTK